MARKNRDEKTRSLGQQMRDARYATLDSRAASGPANQLVDRLADEIANWEIRYGRRRRGRRSGAAKLRAAVTGLFGDLLLARKSQTAGFIVRCRRASTMLLTLKDLDLMEHKPPVNFWAGGFDNGKQSVHRRFAARLRANGKLLKLCREYGITAFQ
jgi:hypothetical protein